MTYKIIFSASADDDLAQIYDWIADQSLPAIASAYVSRIYDSCLTLDSYPNRGTPRDDLGPGVRTVSFERQAVIAYRVDGEAVRILRVLHRGRDLGLAFRDG